eukprot:g32981.t1
MDLVTCAWMQKMWAMFFVTIFTMEKDDAGILIKQKECELEDKMNIVRIATSRIDEISAGDVVYVGSTKAFVKVPHGRLECRGLWRVGCKIGSVTENK